MNKVVPFELEDKEYVAIFKSYYSDTFDREITQCTLVTLPERYILSGATMCHKNDTFKEVEGERIAFRRAVLAYLLLKDKAANLQYSLAELKFTIKLFQKAMGRANYELFGKEE